MLEQSTLPRDVPVPRWLQIAATRGPEVELAEIDTVLRRPYLSNRERMVLHYVRDWILTHTVSE